MAESSPSNRRPCWSTVAERFSDPRDCLIAYIALEAAEVLSGVKPANLLNIPNRLRSCGKNLYELWRQYGRSVVEIAGLEARELVDRKESLLLLIYSKDALSELLRRKNVAIVLARAGYAVPLETPVVLNEVERRLRLGPFPHEIGVFLGYPLKDVMGFMGWAPLPYACQGPWKIYGDPASSLELAEACRKCRQKMARRLSRCSRPDICLNRGRRSRRICRYEGDFSRR